MYEVVKRVKNTPIWRMVGARGHYIVRLDNSRYVTFRTVKEAVAFCENGHGKK